MEDERQLKECVNAIFEYLESECLDKERQRGVIERCLKYLNRGD